MYGLPIGAARGMPASSPIATVRTGSQFLIFPSTTSQSRLCKPDAAIPGKLNRAIERSSGRLARSAITTLAGQTGRVRGGLVPLVLRLADVVVHPGDALHISPNLGRCSCGLISLAPNLPPVTLTDEAMKLAATLLQIAVDPVAVTNRLDELNTATAALRSAIDGHAGAVAQAPTNHLFLVGFNRSSRSFLVSSCARADLSNGRMRTPGQGLLAMGSPPSIQQRVHVKTGAFASNVFQSCVSCRLIIGCCQWGRK